MKRNATLGLLLSVALSAGLSATTLIGRLTYADGRPVNGVLTLTPSQRFNVLNTGNCGGPSSLTVISPPHIPIFQGSPPVGTTVVGNDCISPADTYYGARLVDSTGNIAFSEFWRVTGSVADIGEILPILNPGATPLAVGGDVTGDVTQTIVQRLRGFPISNTAPINGQILLFQGGQWAPGNTAGTGTVTSVNVSVPTELISTGGPITSAGTIALAWANAIQNGVLAGPVSGGAGLPTIRLLGPADIPAIAESGVTGLVADLAGKVPVTRLVTAGAGLQGGGDLSADRTLSIAAGGVTDSMMADGVASANTAGAIVKRDGSGNFAAGTITGTLTGTATNVSGVVAIVNGGTGQSSRASAFDALSPMTTTGDTIYQAGGGNARLPGNTTATKKFLTQTGDGVNSAAPAWNVLLAGDVPAIPESGVTNLLADLAARALTSTSVTATSPLTGSGTLGGNLTLGVLPCAGGVSHNAGVAPDPGAAPSGLFLRDDCSWAAAAGGGGTVTSVGLSMPSIFIVGGSPVTGASTLGVTLNTQVANSVFAGPSSGGAVAPTFRALVAGDVPAIPESGVTNLVSDLAAKADKATTVTAVAPLAGSGTLGSNLTLSVGTFSNTQPGVVSATGSTTKFVRGDNTVQDVVTSVDLTMPAEFSVAGPPITTTGTIAVTKANQTANTTYHGPATGSPAPPTFRATVPADIPALPESQITNLTADLAAKVPATRSLLTTAPLRIDGGGSADLSADRTFSLTLNGGGCLSASGGLGIASGCITDAMLSPSTGFVKRDGSTQLTNSWNIGPQNLGLNVAVPLYGWHQLGGGMREQAVASPGAPSVVPQGTTGGTTYNYQIVAIDHNGGKTLAGAAGTTVVGNATLTPSNFNHITWTAVPGASTYDVTINGTSTSVATNIATNFFDDIGGTQAPYTAPVRNSTADLTIDGQLTADVQFTGPITVPGSVTATQFISNIATGTAPLVVASTTPVSNLTLASDTQLPTISTAGKVSNSATTGTSANTPNTLVLRNGSGNFSAGTITADVIGNLTGNATNFTGALAGDVTGTQGATVVALVGTSTAANVHAAELLANAATATNTASTIVRRDGSGNFAAGAPTFAGQITSSLATGTAPLLIASTTPVANLSLFADTQLPTISTAGKVQNSATTGTAANSPSTLVLRDGSGNIAAGAITATTLTSTIATGTAPLTVTSTTPVANLTLAADSQLPTISTAGKVANTATTGVATNTPNTLVLRDGSGNFAAANITGTQFTGPATALSVNGGAAAVDVSGSSVPSAGQVLVASDATHAHFVSATSTGAVPVTRTITTTAPLTIDGGTSADLSADRTLGIALTTAATGGAIVAQTTSPGVIQGTSGNTNFNIAGSGVATSFALGPDFQAGTATPGSNGIRISPSTWYSWPTFSGASFTHVDLDGNSTFPPNFSFRTSNFNGGSGPGTTASGDILGQIRFAGLDSVSFSSSNYNSSILSHAAENFTGTAHGSSLDFYTTPNTTRTQVLGLTLENSGQLTIPVGKLVVSTQPAVIGATTTTLPAGIDVNGPIATRKADVTLANGLNSNITLPASSFIRLVGATGAFSVGGWTLGVDGRILRLYNTLSQTMTIVNEDVSSTPANRITTLTGANVVLRSNAPSFATLIYDSTASRWILNSTN